MPDAFDTWVARLEARHLANLTLPEVARGLRALSSAYVERRQTALPGGRPLDGAGKRAAFALYYAPLHFLAVSHALEAMKAGGSPLPVLDLGCGTGAVGAAAAAVTGAGSVTGLDTHPWALDEARQTYADFDLSFAVSRGSAVRFRAPRQPAFVAAGYVVNELSDEERERLRPALARAARQGSHVMIIEPLAGRAVPWWSLWAEELERAGWKSREWKLAVEPPDIVRRLGEAAGLTPTRVNIRTLTAGIGS